MMKYISLTLACFYCSLAMAQKTDSFNFTAPESKITGSAFNKLTFLDGRPEKGNLGIAQVGVFNKKVQVVPETTMEKQVADVFAGMIGQDAGQGEVLLHLRQFMFAELTGAVSEKGYCYLRADLYEKKDDNYYKRDGIDTVVLVRAADVTRKMYSRGGKALTDFIASGLKLVSATSVRPYNYQEIVHIDSVEKESMKLYHAAALTDGMYLSYDAFKDQVPDYNPISCKIKNNILLRVSAIDNNGKELAVKEKDIYAVVNKGIPYIATDYGYYPLFKLENDFFYRGRIKATANASDVMVASVFFGALGGLVAGASGSEVTDVRIDHISGGLIPVRRGR